MAIHDQQKQYWQEMVKLKAASFYIRYYRDYLSRWVTAIATVRAVASSVSIAGWAVWREFAFVWALIIALSQIADALKEVFPIAKRHKAAGELASALENLFVDAQLEWDNISSGKYTNDEISARLHRLRSIAPETEHRSFPEGLSERPTLMDRAKQDTRVYFDKTYGVS